MRKVPALACFFAALVACGAARSDEQAAIDACIDQVRTVTGGLGGEVLSSEASAASVTVILRDSQGTVWNCVGNTDGTLGDLRVDEEANADDGDGAMAGAARNDEVTVRFASGTSGATLNDELGSGDAVRYVLGAKEGQFLTVELRGNSQYLNYIVYVPGGDILFESAQGGYVYKGQLYLSGDHVVEVFYNGDAGSTGAYDIIFEIE